MPTIDELLAKRWTVRKYSIEDKQRLVELFMSSIESCEQPADFAYLVGHSLAEFAKKTINDQGAKSVLEAINKVALEEIAKK